MPVGAVATSFDHLSRFGQGCLLVDVRIAMQVIQILGNEFSIGIMPRSTADPVSGVDAAGAQVWNRIF